MISIRATTLVRAQARGNQPLPEPMPQILNKQPFSGLAVTVAAVVISATRLF